MCGLAGRFHAAALAPDPGWAARADELLRHRGPDGAGRYADEQCELVHRRLALIDLSPRGAQPMTNEDGAIQVVYNGEIYNHADLRAALARRGHVFKSTSDTEILVHLYEEEGANLVRALRGIFAFAIYDRPRRRLLLARDRYGVKPLFYAELDGEWLFASEIKAIVARRGFVPRLDRQACYDFLGLGYGPEPATGFANVRALPPGSVLTIAPEGTHLAGYDHVVATPRPERRLEDTVEALADRLLTAVRRQSGADVPVPAPPSRGLHAGRRAPPRRHRLLARRRDPRARRAGPDGHLQRALPRQGTRRNRRRARRRDPLPHPAPYDRSRRLGALSRRAVRPVAALRSTVRRHQPGADVLDLARRPGTGHHLHPVGRRRRRSVRRIPVLLARQPPDAGRGAAGVAAARHAAHDRRPHPLDRELGPAAHQSAHARGSRSQRLQHAPRRPRKLPERRPEGRAGARRSA